MVLYRVTNEISENLFQRRRVGLEHRQGAVDLVPKGETDAELSRGPGSDRDDRLDDAVAEARGRCALALRILIPEIEEPADVDPRPRLFREIAGVSAVHVVAFVRRALQRLARAVCSDVEEVAF